MKIVHVLSQVFLSGPEFYATALAEQQMKEGHQVYIISDTLTAQSKAKYIAQPIGNRKFFQRFKNVRMLRKFLKEEKVDIVHAHSRAASWVSFFACKKAKVPLVSTIHGRQHIHASSKAKDIYGQAVIGVCENLAPHLSQELGMDKLKISCIPNPIDEDYLRSAQSRKPSSQLQLLIGGRTNGPKGEMTADLLENIGKDLLSTFPDMQIVLAGGSESYLPENGKQAINEIRNHFGPNAVVGKGIVNDFPGLLQSMDVIIGSGRVAIEALYYNKHLIALGEAGTHYKVEPKNFMEAKKSNFGDMQALKDQDYPIDWEQFKNQLIAALESPAHWNSQEQVQAYFSINVVYPQVEKVYQSVM